MGPAYNGHYDGTHNAGPLPLLPAGTEVHPAGAGHVLRDPSVVADGFPLRTWSAGQPEVPPPVRTMVERGLVEIRIDTRVPKAYFSAAGLTALRLLALDRRYIMTTLSRGVDEGVARQGKVGRPARRLMAWHTPRAASDGIGPVIRTLWRFGRVHGRLMMPLHAGCVRRQGSVMSIHWGRGDTSNGANKGCRPSPGRYGKSGRILAEHPLKGGPERNALGAAEERPKVFRRCH